MKENVGGHLGSRDSGQDPSLVEGTPSKFY